MSHYISLVRDRETFKHSWSPTKSLFCAFCHTTSHSLEKYWGKHNVNPSRKEKITYTTILYVLKSNQHAKNVNITKPNELLRKYSIFINTRWWIVLQKIVDDTNGQVEETTHIHSLNLVQEHEKMDFYENQEHVFLEVH